MNLKIDFAGLGGSTSAMIDEESKVNPNIRYFGYQNARALIFPTGYMETGTMSCGHYME